MTRACDIIIPIWNQWSLTRACIASVYEKTGIPFRLILIDNGSEEEGRKGLEEMARDPSRDVLLLRNEENLGYVKAVNQGLAASSAPYVCLLNNDVVVTEGWLEKMMRFAAGHPEAGLVNCLMNENPGAKMPSDLEEFARARVEPENSWMELDHCTGTCLLIKREVIEKIGYLDEQFALGQWEDNDYSRRAQKAGYRCFRVLDTYIWHHVSASFQRHPRWKEGEERNRALYYQKWGRPLRILYPVSEGLDLRRARFHQILETTHALARQGCEIDLIVGNNGLDIDRRALPYYGLVRHQNLRIHPVSMLRREGDRFLRVSWNGIFHIAALIKIRGLLRQRAYDAIFLRHLNLANFFGHFRKHHSLPLIFEAHDIFHLTTERKKKERKIHALEFRIYPRLDGFVTISRGLAEKLREIFNLQVPMAVIPDGVNLDFFGQGSTGKGIKNTQNNKIIYVGQFYSWKGVGTLIQSVKYLKGGEVHLLGGGEEQVQKMSQWAHQLGIAGRVFFHGQVSPLQVREYLAESAVAVLPLTQDVISAHFTSPLKLFEYMAARVPIVASDLPSTREILTHGVNALLVQPDNPQALAEGIHQILLDREMADRLSRKAYEDVLAYSWDKRAERLILFLRKITGHQC